jgi:hypothetical protein
MQLVALDKPVTQVVGRLTPAECARACRAASLRFGMLPLLTISTRVVYFAVLK